MQLWGAIALLGGFVLCLAGMALAAIGDAVGNETLVTVGGHLTLPVTLFYAVLLALIVVGLAATGVLTLLQVAGRLLSRSIAALRCRLG